MNKNTPYYLNILVNKIHSVVIATTATNGLPTTRVIDLMAYDDDGIYFLTAKGKLFYSQLMDKSYISLSGMTMGQKSTDRIAISFAGSVRNIGTDKLEAIFEKNLYMEEIYASKESRSALEVFCIYKGKGDYFDLSTKPITRGTFSLGSEKVLNYGYRISETCTACGDCTANCPSNCIIHGQPYVIQQENCLHCGNCAEVCEQKAIIKPKA